MKCKKCGKDEVNFHYSSNVNGVVHQTHLCSECASQSGIDFGRMFDSSSMFSGFSPFGTRSRLMPMTMLGFDPIAMLGIDPAAVFVTWPQAGLPEAECACGGSSCETSVPETDEAQVDGDMKKRREINILKEQMRLAAENEDFEKAAQLRDQVKQMEAE